MSDDSQQQPLCTIIKYYGNSTVDSTVEDHFAKALSLPSFSEKRTRLSSSCDSLPAMTNTVQHSPVGNEANLAKAHSPCQFEPNVCSKIQDKGALFCPEFLDYLIQPDVDMFRDIPQVIGESDESAYLDVSLPMPLALLEEDLQEDSWDWSEPSAPSSSYSMYPACPTTPSLSSPHCPNPTPFPPAYHQFSCWPASPPISLPSLFNNFTDTTLPNPTAAFQSESPSSSFLPLPSQSYFFPPPLSSPIGLQVAPLPSHASNVYTC